MKSTERLNRRKKNFFVAAFSTSFIVGIRVEVRSNPNLNKLRVNDAIFDFPRPCSIFREILSSKVF